ncbi:Common central domain of tyrosinase [Seminavis robusta]|uniref:Common central domain of tyrosinase n=1 Tax=Seminavis robusta TaxID=568900 RepID=A0A9N8DV73_9STRA|nr:Common central domain of tyrosinase [Seminavis robusta]|eukprot:Sro367_g127820.1 Common central domain of tyrosinase (493) ;mRNA; f:55925-57403
MAIYSSITLSLFLLSSFASAEFFAHPLRPDPAPMACGSSPDDATCPTCNAAPRDCHPRVRRSWSTLTVEEKEKFIRALKIIKNTPTPNGQQIYGMEFINYDEFILQHAAAVADPRGDQAHLDQHFSLFHRLLLLRFENTVLSVDPSLQGIPYWDLRDGVESVFGPGEVEFGSTTGTGPNHEVQDGAFAEGWSVSEYEHEMTLGARHLPDDFPLIFSTATGVRLLRSSDVPTNQFVRYPTCTDEVPGPLMYSAANFETCVSQKNFEDFYWCLESPTTNGAHELGHFWIGSADDDGKKFGFGCPDFAPPNLKLPGVRQGDYIDKLTSPNDPIFMLHHAFIDMLSFSFMRRNPDMADQYWGFKASATVASLPQTEGTFLNDMVSSQWPFLGVELLDNADAPSGELHYWEALCWVGPETAAYTYDAFQDANICQEPASADPSSEPVPDESTVLEPTETAVGDALRGAIGTTSSASTLLVSSWLVAMGAVLLGVVAI